MTDEKQIARLTFWLGADASREFAAHKTAERLAEEVYGNAVMTEPDHDE